MLRYQIRVTSESVACSLDLHDNSMMQQPVEQRGCNDWIAKHLSSFSKATI
jgi:hypothetical protein